MKNIVLPNQVKQILNQIENAGFKIYIVGGAVRDLLMGKNVSDWDFTTNAKPEEILKIFPDGFYDNKFGTVGLLINQAGDSEEGSRGVAGTNEMSEDAHRDTKLAGPVASKIYDVTTMRKEGDYESSKSSASSLPMIYEITTMRKEGDYKDFRHPVEVSWTDKLEEDLARRDFTINALALDKDLKIIDPYNAQNDLEKKIIRAVGDPNTRFKEDALRLLRAIRIATQIEFDIDKKTWQAIIDNRDLIKTVASDRIREELFKILGSVNPYIGMVKLREVGILKIILPEVENLFGVVQEGPKHARVYDVGTHSLETLKYTPSPDPLVRFAALLHDIGKFDTKKIEKDGNVTFYNHDLVGGKLALKIASRFNLSKKQTDKLYRLVRWHLFTVDENQTDSAIRRFIKNVGVENIKDMMAIREGDRLGGGTQNPTSWRLESFKKRIKQVLQKPFSISDLKVNGSDVMEVLAIPPSRKVGEILDQLFKEVLKDSEKNNREYLLDKIKTYRKD